MLRMRLPPDRDQCVRMQQWRQRRAGNQSLRALQEVAPHRPTEPGIRSQPGCQEGWEKLTEKTYAMLSAAVTWQPKWQALVKMDDDAMYGGLTQTCNPWISALSITQCLCV